MLSINLAEASHFLTLLDETAEEFTFQTFDDRKDRNDKNLIKVLNGSFDEHKEQLAELNSKGAGIFVTVNQTDLKGRKTENITRPRAVWIEDDNGGAPNPAGLEPHIVVQSSKSHKQHRYYLIDDAVAIELNEWERVQERMVLEYFSDPDAKDSARVMRLPGFVHQKDPANPMQVRLIHESGEQPYTWEHIKQHIPPCEPRETQPSSEPGDVRKLPELRSALSTIDPDCDYGQWINIGMALHHESDDGNAGLQLWDEWSRGDLSPDHKGVKYPVQNSNCLIYKWNSFTSAGNKSGSITGKTIFKLAYDADWVNPFPRQMIDDDKALAFSFPTFDSSNYYGIAGEVALLASADSEADPMAVYVSFLASMAAMLGRYKYIQVGESTHYARLFAVLVGASSRARKGTSLKPVQRIIRKTEEVYKKRNTAPSFTDSLVIADGGLSSAEGLIFKVRDESEEVDKKGNPAWDGVEDKRLCVVEEELANVLKISQREGNTLSPLLRKCWDGGTLAPMTKNNRLKSTNPHINILGHITQFEIKHLMSESDLHNGLSNRCLWACVRRTKKMAFPKPMDDDKVYQFAIKLSDALKKSEVEQSIELNPDARKFWDAQYHIVSSDKPGLLGSITARSEAYVLRLSLLFCLIDGLDAIKVEHMQAAIDLIDFCNESVEFIFLTPADSEEGTDADKLLKALADKSLTQTEVSKLFNNHKSRRNLSTMLTDLQALNKIKSNKQPGSKTIIWEKI